MGNVLIYISEIPGTPSSKYKGDTVSCQDPGQAGEIRMTIWAFFKHTLVQLSLKITHIDTQRNEVFLMGTKL